MCRNIGIKFILRGRERVSLSLLLLRFNDVPFVLTESSLLLLVLFFFLACEDYGGRLDDSFTASCCLFGFHWRSAHE